MPAQSALASTSTAARSPAASSERNKATARSIFVGLGAGIWPDDLEALRWWICWEDADLVGPGAANASAGFRGAVPPGSKLSGLETRLGGPAVKAALRPGLSFSSSAPCSSSQSSWRACFGVGRGGVTNERSCQLVWIRLLSQAKFQSPKPE